MFAGRDKAPKTTEQEVPRKVREFIRSTKQAQELGKKSKKQKRDILNKLSEYMFLDNKCGYVVWSQK